MFLVINQLNERYHTCLSRSQELSSLGIPGNAVGLTSNTAVVTAERLMYNYALEMVIAAVYAVMYLLYAIRYTMTVKEGCVLLYFSAKLPL